MSTSSVVLSVVPLAVAAAGAVPLARGAARQWRGQLAGRPYELPENYRPALLRAAASAAVLTAGIALAISLPGDGGTAPATTATAAARAAHAPPPAARPSALAHTSPPHRRPAPPPPPTAAPPVPRTLAGPAGGTLQAFADGTRVWLPPQYAYASAAHRTFPLVVAYLPAAAPEDEPLFPAFARRVAAGKADPFVVVLPAGCDADPVRAADLAAGVYRTVPGTSARAVMGVGARAACALRTALTRPGDFGAYVGVAGTYDGGAVPMPSGPLGTSPNVMLASGTGEPRERDSSLRLRNALRQRAGVRVRVVDGVPASRSLGGGQRRHELALAAQYLTEELAAPGVQTRPTTARTTAAAPTVAAARTVPTPRTAPTVRHGPARDTPVAPVTGDAARHGDRATGQHP